jgi:arylsulfatase A-like enzyme/Tfp pilus assembly protein PilF
MPRFRAIAPESILQAGGGTTLRDEDGSDIVVILGKSARGAAAVMLKKRKNWLIRGTGAALALAGLAAVVLLRGPQVEAFTGNLLVITLDTTRADSLGINGGEGNHTPNLDRLAREGILFKNCVTPVPLTLPAHVSLFTGRTPLAHQVRNNGRYALAASETTMAERFKEAGFRSYAVIASYVLLGRFGLNQGFDEYDDSLDSYNVMNSYNTEIPADVVSSRFLGWLAAHKDERFFAWVHFYDPHEPYRPPAEYGGGAAGGDPKRLYLGEVEFMDHHVGCILEGLKNLGLGPRTLIVAVGDHGEAFGEHGEKGHAIFCYEENIRVPLIVHQETALARNKVVEERISLTDILPTLLDIFGLEPGRGIQGRSFAPVLRPGQAVPQARPLYMESLYGFEDWGWAPLEGLVNGDLKFISLPRPELYDLRRDPGERENLFEARPEQAKRLNGLLASFVSSHTESPSPSRREMTVEDVHRLRSLGYVSAVVRPSGGDFDPKDGVARDLKTAEFFKTLEDVPSREVDAALAEFLRANGIEKGPAVYSRLRHFYERRRAWDRVARTLIGIRTQLAWAYSIMKRYDRVVSIGREILDRDPSNSTAHILMGDAFDASGDLEAAQGELGKALELEPENVSLRIKFAELLIKRQKIPEALAAYDRLIANPDVLKDHEFLFKLAVFYAGNGRDRQAAELMRTCCRLHPSGRNYFFQGVILARLEDDEEARASLRIALERYPDELTAEQRDQAEKFIRSPSPAAMSL